MPPLAACLPSEDQPSHGSAGSSMQLPFERRGNRRWLWQPDNWRLASAHASAAWRSFIQAGIILARSWCRPADIHAERG